ncbi:MAG: hypothetical protein KC964_00360 [Candidatus Omnitrophica bacterium]|nr:hypothetical protein [Candidatus Omnitrophota bacterium]
MICVFEPEPVLQALGEFGLVIGSQSVQPNTGACHAIVDFDNAYLEIVWAEEGKTPFADEPRLHMVDRILLTQTGWSPFGLSFRPSKGSNPQVPIRTWDYSAAFLPEGAVPIPIGANHECPNEPLVIVSLFSGRPDERPDRHLLQANRAFGEITAVRVHLSDDSSPSKELTILDEKLPWLQIDSGGESHHVCLEIDERSSGEHHDFSPILPLSISW